MESFVTLEQVKAAHPPIEHSDDDVHLSLLMIAATEKVRRYLGAAAASIEAVGEVEELPASIRVATILTARHLYEASDQPIASRGGLPALAESLLYDLADISIV